MYTLIQPINVFPMVANRLEVDPSWAFSGTPRFNWRLQHFNPGSGEPNTKEFVVPVTKILAEGTNFMTKDQWDGWDAKDVDEEVILTAVCSNLGLTRILS